jgi:hypothetical protein
MQSAEKPDLAIFSALFVQHIHVLHPFEANAKIRS